MTSSTKGSFENASTKRFDFSPEESEIFRAVAQASPRKARAKGASALGRAKRIRCCSSSSAITYLQRLFQTIHLQKTLIAYSFGGFAQHQTSQARGVHTRLPGLCNTRGPWASATGVRARGLSHFCRKEGGGVSSPCFVTNQQRLLQKFEATESRGARKLFGRAAWAAPCSAKRSSYCWLMCCSTANEPHPTRLVNSVDLAKDDHFFPRMPRPEKSEPPTCRRSFECDSSPWRQAHRFKKTGVTTGIVGLSS